MDFANLISKKFGALLAVEGALITMAVQQPDKAMSYMQMACGMALAYCVLEIIDKVIEYKFGIVVVKSVGETK
jgi:hypothetical protein